MGVNSAIIIRGSEDNGFSLEYLVPDIGPVIVQYTNIVLCAREACLTSADMFSS